MIVILPAERISDWDSFHDVCAEVFGFPDFYGRNMNAWIDCLTYLREGDGMSAFELDAGERLEIHVPGFKEFSEKVPDVCGALLECTAFVNRRYLDDQEQPALALILE